MNSQIWFQNITRKEAEEIVIRNKIVSLETKNVLDIFLLNKTKNRNSDFFLILC